MDGKMFSVIIGKHVEAYPSFALAGIDGAVDLIGEDRDIELMESHLWLARI